MQKSCNDFMAILWCPGWKLFLCTGNGVCKLQITGCRDSRECQGCRGVWPEVARPKFYGWKGGGVNAFDFTQASRSRCLFYWASFSRIFAIREKSVVQRTGAIISAMNLRVLTEGL